MKLVKENPRVLKHGDSIAILCKDIKLFWYLEMMIDRNCFPLEIATKYLVGNVVGCGSFGVVRKGFVREATVALKIPL